MRFLGSTWLAVVASVLLLAACSGGGQAWDAAAGDEDAADAGDAVADGDVAVPDGDVEPDPGEDQPTDVCQPKCAGKQCGADGCGGTCGECTSQEKCQGGQCVPVTEACAALDECLPFVCFAESGKCEKCTADDQCADADLVCDEAAGECAQCGADDDCAEGFGCQDQQCVELPCPEKPCAEGEICDVATGQCVACIVSSDCGPGFECVDQECVELPKCASSKDCPQGMICDKAAGWCVECLVKTDCPEGYKCTKEQKCVAMIPCASDKDCTPLGKVCDKVEGECVDCLSDLDCADDHFCQEKVCLADACDQAAVWPACDGTKIVTCNANGSVKTTIQECPPANFCKDAACQPWVCEPGKPGCVGNKAFVCAKDGSAMTSEVDCAALGLVCSGGECKEAVCEANALFCVDPLTLVQCDASGLIATPVPCGNGMFCDAAAKACVPWHCVPDTKGCDAGQAAVCDAYGMEWTGHKDCAAQGLFCVDGDCVVCKPDCTGKNCGDDGCGGSCGTCQAGQLCFEGKCYANACSLGCVGHTVDAYLCALDICPTGLAQNPAFSSPTGDAFDSAWEAVAHFGNADNGLAPKAGGSYALLSNGTATGTAHSTDLPGGGTAPDPFAKDGYNTHDNVEFKLTLTAPAGVTGFSITFIFLSEEYEEWIGASFNDKFYIFLTAPQTTAGQKTIINWSDCSNPAAYSDFTDADGNKKCYIAVNTAFSEPCSAPVTSLAGTGFECGSPDAQHGSSTGWLKTSWSIVPGETFDLVFHIHDASDGIYDSEVILDSFQWRTDAFKPGTDKL